MAENENEKIIYDIKINLGNSIKNTDELKLALESVQKIKKQIGNSPIKITGVEGIATIEQNLRQVRRGLEMLQRGYKIRINGFETIADTEKVLRLFEKEFEDVLKKVNAGNLNKQLQERQKQRQKDLEDERKYREKLADLQAKQNKASNNTQFADEQKARQKENARLQQDILEREEKARKNRAANEAYWNNLEKERTNNSQKLQQSMEAIYKAETQYMNILDQANLKKKLGVQLSEQEFANYQKQLKAAKERYVYRGGDASNLPTLGTRKAFNNEAQDNYIKSLNSRMVEALQMSTSYSQQMNRLSHVLDTATYAWNRSGRTVQQYRDIMLQARSAIEQTAKSLEILHRQTGKAESTTDKMMRGLRTHATWIASSIVASVPLVLPGYAVNTMKELESQFATVEQVMPEIEHAHKASLNPNLSEAERATNLKVVTDEMNEFIEIGHKFGVAVEDVIKSGASIGRMYGQGENGVANTNLLTKQAARIAVADNFPMLQATKGLESALSQFGLQTEDTNQLMINSNRIIDVWTTAAHKGAASAQDLTEGVMLAGAAAHQAGVSFEFLNALIATGVRATGRSGNEIGNSIKSFLNSMQSDKSIKALQDFGINMYQDNGDGTQSLRSMEDVTLDIARMLQTSEKETSNLLLTLAGGKYQVSKLTAILKDYRELVRMTGELNSPEVTGFTDEQIEIQLNTLTRKLESVYSNLKGLFMDIGNDGGLSGLKSIAEYVDNLITGVRELNIEWANWAERLVYAAVVLKGFPYLINNVASKWGEINQRYQNAQSKTVGSMGKSIIDWFGYRPIDSYNRGKADATDTSVIASKGADTQAIDDNTRAEKENAQAKQDSASASNVVVAAGNKEADVKNKNKTATDNNSEAMSKATEIAKQMGLSGVVTAGNVEKIGLASKGATGSVGILTTTMRGASAVMGAFGGPVGIVLTALSLLAPIIIQHVEAMGELKNKAKNARDEFEKWQSTQEEAYNRQIRAAQSAETLADNYNKLKDELDKCSKGTEEYKKIDDDMQMTRDAAINLIGEENIAVDENGKIKIDTIKQVSSKASEAHEADLKQKMEANKARQADVESQIVATKEILKTFDKQTEGIGLLKRAWDSLGWSISAMAHRGKAAMYQFAAAQMRANQLQFGQGGENAMADELQKLANEELKAADYDSAFGVLGSREDIQAIIDSLEAQRDELKIEQEDIANMLAENKDKNPTGGADSDRGNLIAEPPEEKKKGKSKAEKEAEKLAKQQENYNKYLNRAGLIGEQTALNYALRRTSFSDIGNIASGDEFLKAAQIAASDINRPDLAKIIYAQWAHESGRFTTTSGRNNYAGLKDTQGNYRDYGSLEEFAHSYAKDFLRYYDFSNVSTPREFVHELKRNGYFTDNEDTYASSVESIANEIGSSVSSALGRKYYNISGEVNDTNLNSLTEQKLNLLAKDFYDKFGRTLNVTSMKRNGDGSSWHDSGQAIDVADDFIESNLQARNYLIERSKQLGLTPLDEYVNPSPGATGGHLHFSDHGGKIPYTGSTYQASLSSSSLATPAGMVYNLLKAYNVDMEKLNSLANATDIPSMIAATDRAGMNVRYDQKVPIAGDILYGDDGKAYVVRNGGGYISSSGETGNNWKDISNLTDTYTSLQYATGLDLENAGQKLGGLKLSEAVEDFVNMRVDREQNYLEKTMEDIQKEGNRYGVEQRRISNNRGLLGEYDFKSTIDEYNNELNNYLSKKLNFEFLTKAKDKYTQQLDEMFGSGALKEVLNKSGYEDWTQLSSRQLEEIIQGYSKSIGDDYLQNIYNGWKETTDAVDDANVSMQEALTTIRKLNGERTPEEQLDWTLNRQKLNMDYWTANYANTHGGSYDGLEWQTNKQNNQNAIRQVQLYREEIERLEKMQAEAINKKAGQKYIDDLTNHILEMRTKLVEAEKTVDETGDRLTRKSKETISGMLHDLIKGGSSFKDVWKNIWDEVAKIALDRILGIKDSTNSIWDLISNIFGFSGSSKTVGEGVASETRRFVDNQNITNGSREYSPMSTAERVGYSLSAGGVADFYANGTNEQTTALMQQSADTNLQAAQIGQQSSAVNQAVSTVSQAVSATDQASSTIDQTAAATMSAASSEMLIASADMLAAANIMATTSFNDSFGKLPFAKGGSLMGFARGGRMLAGGGKVKGAGTGTSDSILAYLQDQNRFIGISDGEYVMNAKATKKYEGILKMMNMDKFASGGSLSTAPVPYIPTLKNPSIVSKIAKQDANNKNQNATMEKLLGQQNGILQGIANSNSEGNGNSGQVVVLNTRASKEEVFSALASDPRALQKLLGSNRSRGFR